MARETIKLPKLSSAVSSVLLHVGIVFAVVFGGQLVAHAAHAETLNAVGQIVIAAGAAGVSAAVHYLLGLIPVPAASK